jgi:tetratricopeptide (TPR) repeat protein
MIKAAFMPTHSSEPKKLKPQEQRSLDLEIDFLAGLVRRAPDYVEALQILGDDLTRRGRFAEGLQVDEQLVRLRPDDPFVHYNLACSYSRTAQHEAAFSALDQALDLGYADFKWLAKDPDLSNLRAHPCFKKIQAKVRRLRTLDLRRQG